MRRTRRDLLQHSHHGEHGVGGRGLMRIVGAVAVLLLALEVVFLGALLPLDDAIWLRVLLVRGCTTDQTIAQLVDGASIAMGALAAAAVVLYGWRRGWVATWPFLALFPIAALANDVLKDLLPRARPSNLPGVVVGHGFPSGHVMNVAVAMIIVCTIATSLRRPWLWRVSAVALTSIVAAGRVLYGAHWFLDVVGAVLTAIALTGLGLPAFRRRPLVAPVALALALLMVMGVHVFVPAAVVRLPAPLTAAGAEFLDVEPGAGATSSSLSGNWSGRGYEDPAGSLAWVRGVGGASVFETSWVEAAERAEAGESNVVVPPPVATEEGPGELLVLVARPDTRSSVCRQVRIAVNGHIVASFVPFIGWREYRIPLARGTYRRGFNELQLAVRALDGTPERLAVSRFRLRLH